MKNPTQELLTSLYNWIFLIALFLMMYISNFCGRISPYDAQRLVLSVLATLAGLWVCKLALPVLFVRAPKAYALQQTAGVLPQSAAITVAVCSVVFAGAVSSSLAASPRHAWAEYANYVLLAAAVGLLGKGASLPQQRRRQVYFLGAFCALYAIMEFFLCILALQNPDGPLPADAIAGSFVNIRFFNHTQTCTLGLLVLLATPYIKSRQQRLFWFIASSLWWSVALISGGRGTQLGMLTAAVACLFLFGKRSHPYIKVLLLTWLVGFLVAFVLENNFLSSKLARLQDSSSVYGRLALWKAALEQFAQHPVWGMGPMHFAALPSRLGLASSGQHNWLIQLASEWGSIALAGVCYVLWRITAAVRRTRHWLQTGQTQAELEWLAYCTTFAAMLVDGLVSNTFTIPVSLGFACFAFGLMLGFAMQQGWADMGQKRQILDNAAAKQTLRYRFFAIVPLLIVCMVCIWACMWPEMQLVLRNQEMVYSPQEVGMRRPRWFFEGHFEIEQ